MPATTYTLVPIPLWLSFDLTGKAAGGASLYSWESLDKTQPKPIFQDSGGMLPYTNPILFDLNGEAPGPFFFADDAAYFLELYDSSGNLIWDMDGYGPGIAGGGGGGTITNNLFIENLIANNVFNYNIGSSDNPIATTNLVLAPSAHDIYKPDIRFIKNNTAATDQIVFGQFTLGSNALTGDITPEYYLQYTCSAVGGGGETQKCIQFPIIKHVQNLSNEVITFAVWAKGVTGTQQLTFFLYQDFGTGGAPSVVAPVAVQTFNLTTSWHQYVVTATVPSVTGKTVGTCGNDALYLQIGLPLSATTVIQFTKPKIYVGSLSSALGPNFDTYDQIDAITNSPRSGDIRISLNSFYPFGWVPMNDGTIGSASSNATTRANIDTFQLYDQIWSAMSAHQAYAPMYSSAGVLTVYGANSSADFSANNQLSLTKALGQVFAGTSPLIPSAKTYTVNTGVSTSLLNVTSSVEFGTATPIILQNSGGGAPTGLTVNTLYYAIYVGATTLRLATSIANALSNTFLTFSTNGTGTNTIQVLGNVLGLAKGEETHIQLEAELASHQHAGTYQVASVGAGGIQVLSAGAATPSAITPIPLDGSSTPFNVTQPTTYMNVFIKL